MDKVWNCWRVKDYTASFFDGDFTFRFTANISNASATSYPMSVIFGLSNVAADTPDDWGATDGFYLFGIRTTGTDYKYALRVRQGNADTTDYSSAITAGTDYYITITRDDDAGTNSTGL
jgi:hypothetical protein